MITKKQAGATGKDTVIHSRPLCDETADLQFLNQITFKPTGKLQTSTKRPGDWVLPLRSSDGWSASVGPNNAELWHFAADCPHRKEGE